MSKMSERHQEAARKREAAKKGPGAGNVQQGRYVKLVQTDKNTLELAATTGGMKEFIEDNSDHFGPDTLEAIGAPESTIPRHNVWGDHQILAELLDDLTSNGWDWIQPEDIGALTDAPILQAPDGRVYWHERYQIESASDELLQGKMVKFDGAPENKQTKAGKTAEADKSGFYVTTFCNFAHSLRTGRPIGHECHILPVAALEAERNGDMDTAIEILRTQGKGPVVKGRSAKESSAKTADPVPAAPVAPVDAAPVADVSPAAAPSVPAPVDMIPASVYAGMSTEALSEMIKTLTSLKDFVNDKVSQQMVEAMSEELKSRPIETEEQKTASIGGGGSAYTSNEETGSIIEGDTSIPEGKDEVDDNTGITYPPTTLPKNASTVSEAQEEDGVTYRIEYWQERDRLYIGLVDETNERDVFELWDDQAREALEDGFIDSHDMIGSAISYAKSMGMLQAGEQRAVTAGDESEEQDHTASAKKADTSVPISDDETGEVIEGESLPSGHDEEETVPGITQPATESLDKFASKTKTATVNEKETIDGITYELTAWKDTYKNEQALSLSNAQTGEVYLEAEGDEAAELWDAWYFAKDRNAGPTQGDFDQSDRVQFFVDLAKKRGLIKHASTKFAAKKIADDAYTSGAGVGEPSKDGPCDDFEGHTKPWGKCWNCRHDYSEHAEGKEKQASAKTASEPDGLVDLLQSLSSEGYSLQQIIGLVENCWHRHGLGDYAFDHVASAKTAAEVTTTKALKLAEDSAEKLQSLYLSAKPILAANESRPVREAVEAIYGAMVLFTEALKVLAKQSRQEDAEEELVKSQDKTKKSGLIRAAAEPEEDGPEDEEPEEKTAFKKITHGLILAAAE
jgi:hypothetical protein